MRLAPQVDGLERLEQALTGSQARGLVTREGDIWRTKQPGGAEDLASVLGRAAQTGSPSLPGLFAAVELVDEAFEEVGLDRRRVSWNVPH